MRADSKYLYLNHFYWSKCKLLLFNRPGHYVTQSFSRHFVRLASYISMYDFTIENNLFKSYARKKENTNQNPEAHG